MKFGKMSKSNGNKMYDKVKMLTRKYGDMVNE